VIWRTASNWFLDAATYARDGDFKNAGSRRDVDFAR
jgi:hypothetical protein